MPGLRIHRKIIESNSKQNILILSLKTLAGGLFMLKRKKGNRRILKKVKWVLLILLFLLVGSGIFFIAKNYPKYVKTKEDVYQFVSDMDSGTFRRKGNTYVYDKDGKKIGKIGNEKYIYKESSKISDYIKNGYIAQEDRHFASHHGVDLKGIARAGIVMLKNKGHATQGASTITQQVVKNNLLSSERTIKRKVTEIMIAMQLEKTYSKAQIMEFYCNSNYYGCGCYGVEGASQYYFGHSAADVSLAEAAMLVGVSNRPSAYNPVTSYDKAIAKKNEVLSSMLKQGYITEKEYKQAKKETPKIVEKTDNTDADNYMVSYAIHCATLELMKQDGFDFQYDFSSQKKYEQYKKSYKDAYSVAAGNIRSGGYKIYTSFDQKLQHQLQKSVKNGLPTGIQGAAVCIDNSTQMVIAMVGGRSENGEYNRGFLMERNPGSAIKPLLDYGPALNEGVITADSIIKDEKVDFHGYSPKNADLSYRGNMTAREALARSVNTVAVKLLNQTDIKTAFPYLAKLHFSSLCYADTTILSTGLGGFTYGVKVVDMAKGYATLANGGRYSSNTCLRQIKEEDGSIIYRSGKDTEEVYNKDTAYILTDMMQGTFREDYGTAHKLYDGKQYYAGKTGTTNDNKDAWFCGYSKYYTTSVWAGCDTPKSVEKLKGASYPGYIWSDFMTTIHKNKKKSDFSIPNTVYLSDRNDVERTITLKKDMWKNRPTNFDYRSSITKDLLIEKAKEKRIEKEVKSAEKKVKDFEDYEITDSEGAKNFENYYQAVLDVIEKIEDTSKQQPLKNRAAYKYELLSKSVIDKWNDVIKQEEENAQKKKDLENKEEASKSEEAAVASLKDKKEEVVSWYIDALYERTLYTDAVKQMIKDAESSLEKCTDSENYDTLKYKLSKAVKYAESLPTKEEASSEKESVTMPSEDDYTESTEPATTQAP